MPASIRERSTITCLGTPMLLALCAAMCGCQFAVMAGRIAFGDPQISPAFQARTGVDLSDGEKSIAVICTAPDSIRSEYDTLGDDLQYELGRRMRLRGVKVIDAEDLADAFDAVGGRFDADGLAEHLDADFIAHVKIERFRDRDPASPGLYRGQVSGHIAAFEVSDEGPADSRMVEVMRQEFETSYPSSHPVTADQMPLGIFQKRFLSHLADQVGQQFYPYRLDERL